MTPAQTIRSFERNGPVEGQRADIEEPRNAKAEPWLSVDTLLVGGSLAIGIVLLAIALALKHVSPAMH